LENHERIARRYIYQYAIQTIIRMEISNGLSAGRNAEPAKTSRKTTEKMMYLPVSGGEKSGFLVLLAYRTQIGANNFEIGILPDIVSCHFKHAKMKICDWAE